MRCTIFFFVSCDSQRGTESVGRQMTIFYGGQAHVFDNVHPSKVCFCISFDCFTDLKN